MPVRLRADLRRQAIRQPRLRALAQKIMTEAGAPDAELSVALVGDRRMRELNRQYRRRDRSTDVLAFAMREAPVPGSSLLGDVVISLDTALRQARKAGHSLDQEVVILLIHGILHLLGFDHERSGHEARRMQRKERSVFQALQPLPRLIRSGGRGR
jgi:probable rRNA maturation factor